MKMPGKKPKNTTVQKWCGVFSKCMRFFLILFQKPQNFCEALQKVWRDCKNDMIDDWLPTCPYFCPYRTNRLSAIQSQLQKASEIKRATLTVMPPNNMNNIDQHFPETPNHTVETNMPSAFWIIFSINSWILNNGIVFQICSTVSKKCLLCLIQMYYWLGSIVHFTQHVWRVGCNSFDIVCLCVYLCVCYHSYDRTDRLTDLNYGMEVKWKDI